MQAAAITDKEFAEFQSMMLRIAGISLSSAKKSLVSGRLAKRLQHFGLASYGEYLSLLAGREQPGELQIALDLLTTNETYFFREPRHFDFLREHILPQYKNGRGLRVWSAACSTGEEPYSIAMLLADQLGDRGWQLLASDISSRVLVRARGGHYPMERSSHIPREYLVRYCLKGVESQAGTFLVEDALRHKLDFQQINLNEPLPGIGSFDVIFLRNVMIYFNTETKQKVLGRLLAALRPGGYLIVGHSESLNGIVAGVESVVPSVYRKSAA